MKLMRKWTSSMIEMYRPPAPSISCVFIVASTKRSNSEQETSKSSRRLAWLSHWNKFEQEGQEGQAYEEFYAKMHKQQGRRHDQQMPLAGAARRMGSDSLKPRITTVLENMASTNQPTNGRTHPLIEMLVASKNGDRQLQRSFTLRFSQWNKWLWKRHSRQRYKHRSDPLT